MTTLVFCVERPDLSKVPRDDTVVVVPLRWELALDPSLAGYDLVDPARWQSFELANDIQLDLDRAWESLKAAASDDLIGDYAYYFFNVMCPIMYWRHIVQSALIEYKPIVVFLPEVSKEIAFSMPIDPGAGLFTVIKSGRYLVLAQETTKYNVRYFPEVGSVELSGRRILINNLFGIIKREPLALLIKVVSGVFSLAKAISDKNDRVKLGDKNSNVLVIGQPNKCTVLRYLLESNHISYSYQDEGAFNSMIYRSASRKKPDDFQFTFDVDIVELIASWFIELLKFNRNALREVLKQYAKDSPDILLTDSHHNHLVRGLSEEFNRLGKCSVIYPEGAGFSTDQLYQFNKSYEFSADYLFRFFLSTEELRVSASRGRVGIVTGYFADVLDHTEKYPGFLILSRVKSNLRSLTPKQFKRPTVFFDLDLYLDIGVGKAHLRPDSLALRRAIVGIRALVDSGFKVVANLRYRYFYDFLMHRISRDNVTLYMLTSWQTLANTSDVVVVYQSSIGLEALGIKKPVVVFDPFEYPTYIDAWSSMESDVVQNASTVEELVSAVGRLIVSPKRDFDKYEIFFAKQQHCAVDWIKKQIESRSSKASIVGDTHARVA